MELVAITNCCCLTSETAGKGQLGGYVSSIGKVRDDAGT
jgi:hypothetical protein